MSSLLSFFKLLITLFIGALALLFILPQIKLPGSYQIFLVQSGSMSPTINTGDLIIIKPSKEYQLNDIITFNSSQNFTTTHRLIKIEKESYITKGDANNTQDQGSIVLSQILGKVIFTIPKIGYIVTFTKSLSGLISLIIIPSVLIVYQEFIEIKKNIKK